MKNWWLLLILVAAMATACNLSTQPIVNTPESTDTGSQSLLPPPSVTPLVLISQPTLQPPPLPDAATFAPGTQCAVYTTFSGSDPDNLLSLRDQPTVMADQILKLPNNIRVFLIPNAQEVEADGYHWLNIIYIDLTQKRYQGWTARDSFATNGVRDQSIATLRNTGQQAPC
jgi:hypothetical protein